MAVQYEGIVAEDFTTNASLLEIVMDSAVPRSSPTKAQYLVVVVQATGAETIGFGGNIYSTSIEDNAPLGPCYDADNEYLQISSYPRAGSVTSSWKFNWMQVWLICVLNPFRVGDKVIMSFDTSDTGGVMEEIRGYAFRLSGIIGDPNPFPWTGVAATGWTQARRFPFNVFDGSGACFDGSYDAASTPAPFVTKEISSDEPFLGPNTWANPSPFGLVLVTGAYQPALTSFAWSNGDFSTLNEWYDDGPASMVHVMGYGDLSSPPAGNATIFGGCFNTTPTFNPQTTPIQFVPRLFKAGAGPPYVNPDQCGGAISLRSKWRPNEEGSGVTGLAGSGLALDGISLRPGDSTSGPAAYSTMGLSLENIRFRPKDPDSEA